MGVFRPTPSGLAGLALGLAALVLLPLFAGGQWQQVLTSTACFILAASGTAFMYARLGMVSLGQVALMGTGGWVMLRMNHWLALPFEANLAVAAAASMIVGWIFALPALRMRGLYLALITLMAAAGLEVLFSTFRFPNGGPGFWGVAPSAAAPFRRPGIAQGDAAYLAYVIAAAIGGFLLIEAHRRLAPRNWRRRRGIARAAPVRCRMARSAAVMAAWAAVAGTSRCRLGSGGEIVPDIAQGSGEEQQGGGQHRSGKGRRMALFEWRAGSGAARIRAGGRRRRSSGRPPPRP
ncbi:ABC transporter permease [Mangrovicoccus ximenensis]|uniref:hypothetical protein n=1 Tax=Mangrovicoccus ximenensis TaxID=1911570 RepID=UPI000D3A77C9|nr:hypothetical protein [Mangrovicoccus ximenensis]